VGQDQGFADLWRNAQQARGAYVGMWFSFLWTAFKKSQPLVEAPALPPEPYSPTLGESGLKAKAELKLPGFGPLCVAKT
jgi:hypothetical protein